MDWNNQSQYNDGYDCPNADTQDGFMILNSSNPWMDRLWDTEPEFRRELMKRYSSYRPTLIEDMFTMIEEQAAYLDAVQAANSALWGSNFHNGVASLKSWLTRRIAWLDGEWLLENNYEMGDVNLDGVVDAADALTVLRVAQELAEPDAGVARLGDVNGDGEVSSEDALLILRAAMGL